MGFAASATDGDTVNIWILSHKPANSRFSVANSDLFFASFRYTEKPQKKDVVVC